MNKKHQLNIITAQPTLAQKKWNFSCPHETKEFKDGVEIKQKYHPTYYSSRTIEWDNLKQLYKELKPYIQGTRKDAEYSSLMYGTFREGSEDMNGYRRLNANVKDTHHRYLILDIETDSPQFKETCLDIHDVRKWLISSYPWITEETGMILYQTASAGVMQTGKEKHKQIRIRAIMELSVCLPGLNEASRKHVLRPWMKQTGGLDFHRHIDKSTHEKARKFYLSPPKLTRTKRFLTDDICCLHEGEPVEYDSLIDFDIGLPQSAEVGAGVSPTSATFNKEIDEQKLSKELKEKPTEYWWNKIEDGNRYEGHYYMLVSAYYRDEIKTWRNKLLADSFKLGDKSKETIDSVIQYIEKTVVKDYDKPTDKIDNHNVIDIPIHRLSEWEDSIQWKDKGVILQKLYEGAGKTESLKKLVAWAKDNDKSFLYIAPNTKTVINESEKLGLSNYQKVNVADTPMDVDGGDSSPLKPLHPYLGICYPSLEKMKGKTPGTIKRGLEWDIVVMDEIEQLLIFAVDGGGCIMNPEKANGILRQLVETAELVVGMDARLSNLSLQALEEWRVEDKVFDIYTQSKIKPWNNKNFTMVDSTEMVINYVREAVSKGKRVAVVSELDRKGKGATLETLKDYIEEQTGKKGWALDQANKNEDEAKRYIDKLGRLTDKGIYEMGELEKDLKNKTITHMWASPVIQSAWSYQSEECPFDLVVGLYPNSVLTAPNIVQHISRFRTSTEFVLYVNQQKRFRPFDIYQRMYPKVLEDDIDLGLGEFNQRHEMHDYWENIQKQNRQSHLIEIIEARGGEIEYDHTRIIDENRELARWLEKNREKAWKMVRSKEIWDVYADIKKAEKRISESIYDI